MIFNNDIEKYILASCLVANKQSLINQVCDNLTTDDFYDNSNKHIFETIEGIVAEETELSIPSVEVKIAEQHKNKYYDLFEYSSGINVDRFINDLQNITITRKLFFESKEYAHKIINSTDYKKSNDDYEKNIFEILKSRKSKNKGFKFNEGISDYISELQSDIETNRAKGINTGIPSLDKITGGLRGGEQIVVAGRPSMGKSSFALSMIAQQILDYKSPALFSLEMGKREIYDKMYSIMSDKTGKSTPYYNLRNPYNLSGLTDGLRSTTDILKSSNMYVNCDTNIKFNDIKSICRELKYKDELDIVYIDHIGLMVSDRNSERAELTEITNSGKKLASELDIPVVIIVQLRRDLDTKGGQPTLGHLKGSGSIEEDANIVLFPWRGCIIDKSEPETKAVLIMAKSRNSSTKSIPMYFSTESTLFTETTVDEKEIIKVKSYSNKEFF
jgi:replicative DNA helicase